MSDIPKLIKDILPAPQVQCWSEEYLIIKQQIVRGMITNGVNSILGKDPMDRSGPLGILSSLAQLNELSESVKSKNPFDKYSTLGDFVIEKAEEDYWIMRKIEGIFSKSERVEESIDYKSVIGGLTIFTAIHTLGKRVEQKTINNEDINIVQEKLNSYIADKSYVRPRGRTR